MKTRLALLLAILCFTSTAKAQNRLSANSLKNSPAVKSAFRDLVAPSKASVVRVLVDDEPKVLGTIVDKDGFVVTKASLLNGELSCELPNGKVVAALSVGKDEAYDIALLKVDAEGLTSPAWGNTIPQSGSWVAAVGQTKDPIAVGILTVEPREFSIGGRNPNRGYLGVTIAPAEGGGVLINEILNNSGADKAGLKTGDVIIKAKGKDIKTPDELVGMLSKMKPRDKVELVIRRGDKEQNKTAVLGRAPPQNNTGAATDRWGGGPFSDRRFGFPKVLAHDTVLRPSQCGGPLVDTSGKVIGVNIARALRVSTYAIPADAIQKVTADLRKAAPKRIVFQKKRWIDPAGIAGALVICGGEASEEALAKFVDLAGDGKAQIVILRSGDQDAVKAATNRLQEAFKKQKEAKVELSQIDSVEAANDAKLQEQLNKATGVWLLGSDAEQLGKTLVGSETAQALAEVVKRGGVVGGSLAGAAVMPQESLIKDKSLQGLNLLPDSVLAVATDGKSSRVANALKEKNDLVGYDVPAGSAIIIRKRYVVPLGDGVSTVHLAAAPKRPAARITLNSKAKRGDGTTSTQRVADLTALRRSALLRSGPQFPPEQLEAAEVKDGTLIIVGGGGMPKGLLDKFVELAGGKKASIVVLPTALPDPLPERDRMGEALRKAGAGKVTTLKARKREDVESKEFLDALRGATGIWFGGGRQWRFVDAYMGTKAEKLMHNVLKRGGVIAGSSAGASIQAEYLARGNPLGNLDIMADGYEVGMGFLKGVAVDQHFTQRGRLKDMTSLVDRHPQLLGIGIDETTAIIVKGQIAEVVGRNRVCFYDRNKPVEKDKPDYEEAKAGERYDLVARKLLGDRYLQYAQARVKKYDENKDGILSKEEWSKMRRPPEKADADGDGKITAREYAAFLRKK